MVRKIFGKYWENCQNLEKVPVPIGQICLFCEEPIQRYHSGEMINDGTTAVHRECLVRQVVGSIGHQQKKCSCYGGNEEDPSGLSKRQAAILACQYFDRMYKI